jgi:hypothetical protein
MGRIESLRGRALSLALDAILVRRLGWQKAHLDVAT